MSAFEGSALSARGNRDEGDGVTSGKLVAVSVGAP